MLAEEGVFLAANLQCLCLYICLTLIKISRDDHGTQRPSVDGQTDRDFNAISQPIKAPRTLCLGAGILQSISLGLSLCELKLSYSNL